jgi:hypothetical protein
MAARNSDVESVDAIITAAYEVVSGKAGEQRDWDRLRSLFAPGARLIPTSREAGVRVPDEQPPQPLDVEGYIRRAENYFRDVAFYEREIARRTEQFGGIAHAFSTYDSKHDPADAQPFMRGINSIQLYHNGTRWWIITIYWQQENLETPIPEKYLSQG